RARSPPATGPGRRTRRRRRRPLVSAGVVDLSLWQLALALLLVAAVAIVSIRQALGLERDLLLGSIRTVVQLYGVGLILAAVFAAARWYWVGLILVVMTAVAT